METTLLVVCLMILVGEIGVEIYISYTNSREKRKEAQIWSLAERWMGMPRNELGMFGSTIFGSLLGFVFFMFVKNTPFGRWVIELGYDPLNEQVNIVKLVLILSMFILGIFIVRTSVVLLGSVTGKILVTFVEVYRSIVYRI